MSTKRKDYLHIFGMEKHISQQCCNVLKDYLKVCVRISDVWLGGSGKEKMKGHRKKREIPPEQVALGLSNVLLKCIVEHHPVQTNTYL